MTARRYRPLRLSAALWLIGSFLVIAPVAATAAISCGGERVTIPGTSGNDILTGTAGRDVIHGRGGDDVIRGLGGNDLIRPDLWGYRKRPHPRRSRQ